MSISGNRKWFLWPLMLLIPVCFFSLIEIACRLAEPSIPDDPYMSFSGKPDFFSEELVNGKHYVRINHPQIYRAREVMFSAKKGENTVRIVCLGGSASAGWPHPPTEIYSAYLEKALQHSFPGKTIEVINASGHAYAAYRVRLIFEEMMNYDPDLIIIYSGNNEFVEDRTYIKTQEIFGPLFSIMNKSAAFRVARAWTVKFTQRGNKKLSASLRSPMRFAIWSKVKQRALKLRKDPEQFESVKQHYSHSIEMMIKRARQRTIPVVLVTVPVNLRDWHPNVSIHSAEGEELLRWQKLYQAGRRALLEDKPHKAVGSLTEATALDPVHADSHFYLAQAFEQSGDYENATREYDKARDLDHNPFRASSEFNDIIQTVGHRNKGVYIADVDTSFRTASAPFAPGFNLFLDYVHPTRQGNLIVAKTVYDLILQKRILGQSAGPAAFESGINETTYSEANDYPMQGTLLRLFGMMHQYESMVTKARFIDKMGNKIEPVGKRVLWRPEESAELVAAVLEVFPDFLELKRREIMGVPFTTVESDLILDRVEKFYRDHYGINRYRIRQELESVSD